MADLKKGRYYLTRSLRVEDDLAECCLQRNVQTAMLVVLAAYFAYVSVSQQKKKKNHCIFQ